MVANTRIDELDLNRDRCLALEAEIEHMRREFEVLVRKLAFERARRDELAHALGAAAARIRVFEHGLGGEDAELEDRVSEDRVSEDRVPEDRVPEDRVPEDRVPEDNVYVFDDEDESRAAFDEFFAAPDPHLDRVRGFLLD